MKRLLSLIFTVVMLAASTLYTDAKTVEIADCGKTVITIGDWVYEKINDGTQWELDEYIGEGGKVFVPRFYADTLVVSMGNHCFANNTNVTSVVTSSPLWTIGEYAFIDCTSLEAIELNPALNSIGIGAFSGTSALKDVNLQDTIVTEIKPFTFLNSGIEQIALPDTCTELTHDSFAQCANLVKVVIPASVTTIHDDAFRMSDQVVIYCYTDSAAHQYAIDKNIPFVLLDARYILGDVDNSGAVDITDATLLQRYDIALSIPDEAKATIMQGDVDRNGLLEITDVTFIQRYLAKLPTPYPIGEEVNVTG